MKIKTVTVIGAGVMGAQIAALLCEAGCKVFLLDVVANKSSDNSSVDRSDLAKTAIKKLSKLKPLVWMSKNAHQRIIPGNIEDDLSVVSESDWVIEAVIEKLSIKKSVHSQIASYHKPGTIVSTNTSGILLKDLITDLPSEYTGSFFATHFFNPPRYMKLVEIITHPGSDLKMVKALGEWIEHRLGKSIVFCNDTINFIANRIGVFALLSTVKTAEDLLINPETTDLLTGKLMARPNSATYRTMDVVGLDTSLYVAKNVYDNVVDDQDPYRSMFLPPKLVDHLVKIGNLGQKTNFCGVYKKTKSTGKNTKTKSEILSYDFSMEQYKPVKVSDIPWLKEAMGIKDYFARLKYILNQDDKYAQLIWTSLAYVFSYSALLVDEIADGYPLKIDNAMKWGFNWEYGVFETWQGLGFNYVANKLASSDNKFHLPHWVKENLNNQDFKFYSCDLQSYRAKIYNDISQYNIKSKSFINLKKPSDFIPLPAISHSFFTYDQSLEDFQSLDHRYITGNKSASLLDIGDGVCCLNFHSKMNAANAQLLEMIARSVDIVNKEFNALVIANDGKAFCAGADLKMLLNLVKNKDFSAIDSMLRNFQGSMQLLKFASFPVVSAVHGMALGGGCEIVLQSTHRHMLSESYVGLVEASVGLIPAAGGTKELAVRAYNFSNINGLDSFEVLKPLFMQVAMAEVSTSAFHCVEKGLIPQFNTTFTLSKAHQTFETKKIALNAYQTGFFPNTLSKNIKVLGSSGYETFKMIIYNFKQGNMITDYDVVVAESLAYVLSGGDLDLNTCVDEQWFLDLERNVFLELCKEARTEQRIEHMLTKGKPLRN